MLYIYRKNVKKASGYNFKELCSHNHMEDNSDDLCT